MTCLGERITALVDGRLSPDAEGRATAHIRVCRVCRDAVEAERLTKARLAALGGLRLDPGLLNRLLDLGGPMGPMPPRPGHVPGTPRPVAVRVAPPTRVDSRAPRSARAAGQRDRVSRPRRLAAVLGALSVMGVGAVALGVAGTSGRQPAPSAPDVLVVRATPCATTASWPRQGLGMRLPCR